MKIAKNDMIALIDHWRSLVPKRPLTYGEHLEYGREQAHHMRALWDENQPAINLIWLFEQSVIPVHLVPSYTLWENSGLTTDRDGGRLQIFLNQKEPRKRQRFSLGHEWKHALDFYDQAVLYQKLGNGNARVQQEQVERLADDFAAHLLMPTKLVIDVWGATHSISESAQIFDVSEGAIGTRLEILGLIGKPKPRPRDRFRSLTRTHIYPFPTLCTA